MIQLSNISLQLGKKNLLEKSSLTVHINDKWGIIGENGCGKSSLFKLLLGEIQEDAGQCLIPKDWQIAHMKQETHASCDSAIDHVLKGDKELLNLQKKIDELSIDFEKNGEKLADLYAQLESIDGYTAQARAQKLLFGLGFKTNDDKKSVSEFSGGWRIRLNLAQALMCRSDLLLLDEPTNHLDLDACFWLEQWLKQYKGTLVIISHDRDFLDNVVNRIVNFENQTLITYTGNYSAYEKQKAERLAQQSANFEKQQAHIAHVESFIRRFKAKATKAKQAQSRIKQLERLEVIAPAHIHSPFSFEFEHAEKTSQVLISLSQGDLGYTPHTPILKQLELSVLADTRVGLLGKNGAGKSTLIKTLANEIALLKGKRIDGAHLALGYFSQHQLETLDNNASPILHLQRISPKASEQSLRNFLGGFNFHSDRVFETIELFSGGEKARLALAIIAWQKPNLLILDEPTNHLDIEMCHALTMALQDYQGAVLVVSHDRHLLKNTVDDFWLVNDGKVKEFDGTLEDYAQWISQKPNNPMSSESNKKQQKSASKEKRTQSAEQRQKIKPLKNRIKVLEKAIEKANTQLKAFEEKLADNALYANEPEQVEELIKQQVETKAALEKSEEEWIALTDELEQLES